MFRSYWHIAIAFGLIALLTTSAVPTYGEENEVGGATENAANEQNRPQKFPILVPIESDESTKTREVSEKRAEQRELDDLAAQEGMNEATQKMADYSIYQTILIAIGTIILIYTLYLTRQANRTVLKASAALRDVQRPWIIVLPPTINGLKPISPDGDAHYAFMFNVSFEILNSGTLPATDVRIEAQYISRFCEADPVEIEDVSCILITDEGVTYYDVGVSRFFKTSTAEQLSRTWGIERSTIKQGGDIDYVPFGPSHISISKEVRSSWPKKCCWAISVSYRAPGRDEIFLSQFAFDLWGHSKSFNQMCPPSGPEFIKGENIFYRQTESNIE